MHNNEDTEQGDSYEQVQILQNSSNFWGQHLRKPFLHANKRLFWIHGEVKEKRFSQGSKGTPQFSSSSSIGETGLFTRKRINSPFPIHDLKEKEDMNNWSKNFTPFRYLSEILFLFMLPLREYLVMELETGVFCIFYIFILTV